MDEQTQWTFGAAELRFEPPDVLYMRTWAGLTPEDVHREAEVVGTLARGRRFWVLLDLTGAELSAEVRKESARAFRPEWFAGSVLVGVSPMARLAIRTITLAMTLFGSQTTEVQFAATAEEGRKKLDELRAREKAAA